MISKSLRFFNRPIINIINNHLIDYPTPININYFWNFGFMSGIFLGIQIISGIFLAMHYTSHIDLAFLSVEHIMRNVNSGWFFRYCHSNGASMFFFLVYFHIGRGLFYGSFHKPREIIWLLGVIILILMMATSFIGYVLPWGQMSFWGATVITNLFSAFPFIGESMVSFLWGGFSVDNATLNRFFSFHYFFPFLISSFVILHIIFLHENGSNNPIGINSYTNKISFYPYFIFKDLFSFISFCFFYFSFIFLIPNYLGHTDNYIEANPMVTPSHIVPEWYFLTYYAILRSIPQKLGGVIAMFFSLLVLIFIPFLTKTNVRSSVFRPLYQIFFWLFIVDYFILGWIGECNPESPYLEIGQLGTFFYFFYFLVIIPFLGSVESFLLNYKT